MTNTPAVIKVWGIPGSGKTTKLIAMIQEDIDSGKYTPSDFTVCAYGRRIAKEWRDLLGWSLEDEDDNTKDSGTGTVKTIHGVCKSLAGIHKVITEKQKADFCAEYKMDFKQNSKSSFEVIDEFGLPMLKSTHHLGNLFFDANSFLANCMLSGDMIRRYQGFKHIDSKVPFAPAWMVKKQEQYTLWKQWNAVYDFDDMLTMTYATGASPDTRVLVVDEAQDMTAIMNAIIRGLWIPSAEKSYLAGDPRQTIYSFRGASNSFFEALPGTMVTLPQSWRLPDNLWSYAKNIVERIGQPVPEITPNGKRGVVKKIPEAEYYDMIKRRDFVSDTFHLVRTNHEGMKIAYALMEAGIPFTGIMGWDAEVTALYSLFLKIRNLQADDPIFTKDELTALLLAYPVDMFKTTNKKIWIYLDELTEPYTFSQIQHISRNNIFGKPKLWELIKSSDPLSEAEPHYRNPGNRRSKLINALSKGGQLFNKDVCVSTIHSVKGSERTTVFLHNRTRKDTEFDTIYAKDTSRAQTEANVAYVGATRARQNLYIVNNDCKYHYPFPAVEGL